MEGGAVGERMVRAGAAGEVVGVGIGGLWGVRVFPGGEAYIDARSNTSSCTHTEKKKNRAWESSERALCCCLLGKEGKARAYLYQPRVPQKGGEGDMRRRTEGVYKGPCRSHTEGKS